jgi:predicted ATP-grasp superfamily ATP-dependent carboligase
MVGEEESIDEVAARISYPAVLKPRFSWLHRDGNWANGGVEFAVDAAELKEKYARIHATNPFPLVQRRLEGEGKGVFLLVWDGELKAAFAHRRLREKPPWGGVSTYCESMPIDPDLVQSSLSLLRHIGWNGVAMVEFKVDKLDGVPKLMEINGRLWGSLQLAIDAGVNFPFLFYRLAMGEDVPPQFTYQVGVRSRWFWGDFDQLVIRLKNRGVTAADGRSRLGAIGDFLRLFEAKTRYDVFRLADPAPGWFETRAYLRENFGSRLRGVNRAR